MLLLVKQLYAIIIFVLLFSSWMVENVLCYKQVFSCDFETGSNCTFTQWNYNFDNFDWTQWQGSTGGAYSGPSSDHTYGNISGNYMYTQSNADKRGENAVLQIGEKLQLSAGRGVLRFYYHMEDRDGGDSLGDLKVYGCHQDGHNLDTPMWTRSKSQGDKWLMAEIVYECQGEFQVLFEGVRGTRDSDIAIDDIQLLDLSIDEIVPSVSTSVAMTTTATRSQSMSVDGSGVIQASTGSATGAERGEMQDSTVTTVSYVSRPLIHDMENNNQDPTLKKKMILLIGLTAPMFSIVLLLVLLAFVCYIRKRKRKELEVSSSASVDGVINPYLYDRAGYVELQGPVPSIYTKLQVACGGVGEVDTSAYMSLQNLTSSSFKRLPPPYNSSTVPAPGRSNDPPVYMDPELFRRHSTRRIGANPTYGMDVLNQVGYYHIPDVITQANQRDTYRKDGEVNVEQYHEYFVLEKEENNPRQDEFECCYQADDEEEFTSEKAASRLDVQKDSYLDLCMPEEDTIDSIRLSDYQADDSDSDDYQCLGPNDLGFSGYQLDTQLNNLSAPPQTYIENTVDYTHV